MNITRAQVEDFLYYEAALLDQWKLMEWSDLFTETGRYLVPPLGNDRADYRDSLFIVADDRFRLEQRAKRLLKRQAHVEYPHSTTRHMIGNVRIEGVEDEMVRASCNFVVYRSKREIVDTFVGHSQYLLVPGGEHGFLIQEKRVILDMDALRPHGKLSIIV